MLYGVCVLFVVMLLFVVFIVGCFSVVVLLYSVCCILLWLFMLFLLLVGPGGMPAVALSCTLQ